MRDEVEASLTRLLVADNIIANCNQEVSLWVWGIQ
jgi:hypothetical protein